MLLVGQAQAIPTSQFIRLNRHFFVKEIQVKPGRAAIIYSIPTPDDSPLGGADSAEIALNGGVRKSVRHGGACRTRTGDLSLAKRALSQLS